MVTDTRLEAEIAKVTAGLRRQGVPDSTIATVAATMRRTGAVPTATKKADSASVQRWVTRKSGTVNQRGRPVPIQSGGDDILTETKARDMEASAEDGEALVDPRPLSHDGERCDNCGHAFRQGEQGYIAENGTDRLCKICGRKAQLQNVPLNEITQDRTNGYRGTDGDKCIGVGCGSTRRNLCEHGFCWTCRGVNHCGCRETE